MPKPLNSLPSDRRKELSDAMALTLDREHKMLQELAQFGDEAFSLLSPVISKPDFPLRVIKFAQFMYFRQNQKLQVWEDLALWGHQLANDDPKCLFFSNWARRQRVPEWLFTMAYDEKRNQAYQDALELFIKPGITVLEIGTGCGLFAMMAARAGAGHIYTCEQDPLRADIARNIIRQNGYADRITIIPKKSSEVHVGADLPEKADILLNETS